VLGQSPNTSRRKTTVIPNRARALLPKTPLSCTEVILTPATENRVDGVKCERTWTQQRRLSMTLIMGFASILTLFEDLRGPDRHPPAGPNQSSEKSSCGEVGILIRQVSSGPLIGSTLVRSTCFVENARRTVLI
jgi:hypothetical protein